MSRYLLLALLLARPALPAGCAPVEHESITAHDLAAFLPVFQQLAPDTPIGAAPGPGVRRVFHSLELLSLAKGYGLTLPSAEDLCFEWPMEVPDRARMLEAMQAVLPGPDTRIEILETSLTPAPRGRIEFRQADLGAPALPSAPTPVIWRGSVVYGASHRFEIWARVRITARVNFVVAALPIRQGIPITPGQLRIESAEAFPVSTDLASRIDQVAGRIALRAIAAGTEIRLGQLQQPLDIKRGDSVLVEVLSDSAHLSFTGKAESDGRKGDKISIQNVRSSRVFQARVDGKDRAVVDLRTPSNLSASQRN